MKTKQITVELPEIEQVGFTVECQPEDTSHVGECSAIDDETDKETEEWIESELDSGNEWAWCCVKVTATWRGMEGHDYLHDCSYKSKADFMEPGGYYDDMRQVAFDELIATLAALA